MSYNFVVQANCEKEMDKFSKKNPVLKEALRRKMKEIIENPSHYKPEH